MTLLNHFMDDIIQISTINDFLFWPYSLYAHSIYESFTPKIFHDTYQVVGTIKHKSIDTGTYSSSKRYLKALFVYSEKYGVSGKIDIYDIHTKSLIERKTKVKKLYEGQIMQLYAQYYCMVEMGFAVENLRIHSLIDNKRYKIPLPKKREESRFREILKKMREYDPLKDGFKVSKSKFESCIYSTLCPQKPT